MPVIDRRTFLKAASVATVAAALPPLSAPWVHAGVAGRADQYDATIALSHTRAALRAIKTTPGFSPPVASRLLAYLGISLYAAVAPGMPGYRRLVGLLPGFPETPETPRSGMHWPTVANHAMATTLVALVPAGSDAEALIRNVAATHDASSLLPDPLRRSSTQRGRVVGRAVAAWASADGGHNGHLRNFPEGHVPPMGPGLWEPTPPTSQPIPLQPHWGSNRAFMHRVSAVDGPPPYSTEPGSEFYGYADEVYQVSQNLTTSQREVALYWADDPGTVTPPGHCISMTARVLEAERSSLAVAAETLLRVGCALADAFIQCWHTKYTWNLLRPVTYIRAMIDPAWLPLITTPPFPEYNSGHSTQSGAWSEVMTAIFGSGYGFIDDTHVDSGLEPRFFSSFSQAADEAAVSRLYGGIHYRFGNDSGLTEGRSVGRAAATFDLTR